MPVISNVQVLEDSHRNFVVHLSASITAGGAEVAVKKVDVSTMAKPANGQFVIELSLMELRASTINASLSLICEGANPSGNATLWSFPANFSFHRKFSDFGGIQNTAAAPTGNVLLTTENWGDPQLDGGYDITLWFRKKLASVPASILYANATTLGGGYVTFAGDTVTL